MTSKKTTNYKYPLIIAAAFTLIVAVVHFSNRFTLNDLSTSENTQAAEINYISNSSFESGISNWIFEGDTAPASSLTPDNSTQSDGSYSAKVNVSTTSDESADVQLSQRVSLIAGKQYTISFAVKAPANRDIRFKIDNLNSTTDYFDQTVFVGTNWQTYTFQFTAPASDSGASYEFNVGKFWGDVWIDNARLTSIENTPTPTRSPSPTPTRSPSPTPAPTSQPTRTPSPVPTQTPAPTTVQTNPPQTAAPTQNTSTTQPSTPTPTSYDPPEQDQPEELSYTAQQNQTAKPTTRTQTTPRPTAPQSLTITAPKNSQQILPGQTFQVQWNNNKTSSTTITLKKPTGKTVTTVAQSLKGKIGLNTYSWRVPQVSPSEYLLSISTSDGVSAQSPNFVIGSQLVIYAAGTPYNGIYPTMQLYINNRKVRTYFGVQGDINKRQFAQYYYYSATKLTPNQVKLQFTNDASQGNSNDRNLVVDKVNIDGTIYETEANNTTAKGAISNGMCKDGKLQTEWLTCNGYFQY